MPYITTKSFKESTLTARNILQSIEAIKFPQLKEYPKTSIDSQNFQNHQLVKMIFEERNIKMEKYYKRGGEGIVCKRNLERMLKKSKTMIFGITFYPKMPSIKREDGEINLKEFVNYLKTLVPNPVSNLLELKKTSLTIPLYPLRKYYLHDFDKENR